MKPRRQITIAEAIPGTFLDSLVEQSKLGLGLDVATTEKLKSNPGALALAEQVGMEYYIRLLIRWKSKEPAVYRGIIRHVVELLASRRRRARKLCIDASSEKFFATDLRSDLAGVISVERVVSSEATKYLGEQMNFKVYLGNLYINTLDDNALILPDEPWVKNDARQVKSDKGTFVADVDEAGNHADGFDACKLSLHSLIGAGGRVSANATPLDELGGT